MFAFAISICFTGRQMHPPTTKGVKHEEEEEGGIVRGYEEDKKRLHFWLALLKSSLCLAFGYDIV